MPGDGVPIHESMMDAIPSSREDGGAAMLFAKDGEADLGFVAARRMERARASLDGCH